MGTGYNQNYYTCHEIEFVDRLHLIGGDEMLIRYRDLMPLRKKWNGIDRAKLMEHINAKLKAHRVRNGAKGG